MKAKRKAKYKGKLSLKPLQFDEVVSALLTVKLMPKVKKERKG